MSASKKRPFVKAADTKASPANSRAEIERMLSRYGAVGFGFQMNLETRTITVQFVVPDSPGSSAPRVPVTLPVSVFRVYDALFGRPYRWRNETDEEYQFRRANTDDRRDWRLSLKVHDPKAYDTAKLERAERVAWRNLVLWIDAALSAASIGVQTITEAFLAHTVVVTDDGRQARMMDYLERTQGVLAPGVRALLASPAQED